MNSLRSTRREFLSATALAATTAVAAPYVKTAHSAGKLALLLWDHWVPTTNDAIRQIIGEWAEANHVEAQVDLMDLVEVTAAAEARARTGHDILAFPTWHIALHKNRLEPVDDVVKELTERYGPYVDAAAYLARHDGAWRGVAAPTGSHTHPMASRLDLWREHAGIDLRGLFPAGPRDQAKVEEVWTYDGFLEGAKKLHAAGHPFGNPIGPTDDAQVWLGPLFLSFGAEMVGPDGAVTADSEGTRAALEYMQRLTRYMPEDVYAWGNAGNNRWLISGRGSAVQNPPSAWAVAKRDAPEVAARVWHHDVPRGPNGRFRGSLPSFYGIWEFSRNKSAAKDLLLHLAQREQVSRLLWASQGYDMPLLPSFYDHPVWEEEGPPAGTLYNYPMRGDERVIVAGYPAPPAVAARIYNEGLIPNLVARVTQAGESIDGAIAWAEQELEGYLAR